jgi:MFS family permease
MHLIAPDILVEGQGLAPAISATGLALGFLVWLFGWRAHRFWIVMIATVAAGISGLYSGPRNGIPPLVASLLLAVAFGVLALALARVAAFAAGGVALWMLAHALLPQWDEPLLWVLAGGLLGLWMFRLWMMVVTSAAGTLLMAYSLLWLMEGFGRINAADWAEQRRVMLDWSCVGVAAVGVLTQAVLERSRSRRTKEKEDQAKAAKEEAEAKLKPKKRTWFGFGPASTKKKAG